MKVIIFGGREYRLTHHDRQWLHALQLAIPITEVILGGGRGCDQDAEWWAHHRDLPVRLFPAEWDRYGRAAGPRRNQAMLDYIVPDGGGIAFPGGRGTADMVRRIRQAKVSLWEPGGAVAVARAT